MHETRTLPVGAAQGAEHPVDVTRRAGAALHGKTHRLVEHHDVGVLEEHDRFQKGAILLRGRRIVARRRRFNFQRRNAHGLPGFEASLRLRALAIHPHLAFANDALDVAERQARKSRLEKAIDAHAGFIGRDGDGLDLAGRLQSLRAGHWGRPARRRTATLRLATSG